MKRLTSWFILLAGLAGCVLPSEYSRKDMTTLYDPAVRLTRAGGQAILLNDSMAVVILDLKTADFTYKRLHPDRPPTANILITYSISDSYENLDVVRNDSLHLTDTLSFLSDKFLQPQIRLKLRKKGEFLFSAVILDLNSMRDADFYLLIHNDQVNSRENFFLCNEEDQLIPGDHLAPGKSFRLKSLSVVKPVLYGRYYNRQFPIAIPPYAMDRSEPFRYQADSTFVLDFRQGKTPVLQLNRQGFYHFQADTSDKQGFTVFVADADFPRVSLPWHMLEPLRYITTYKEYEQLSGYQDVKMAVDSFWLFHAGYTERAKNLIYRYYNRVQEANALFTSYLEGWKTDRGMIYIVFGPPNHVFRGTNLENWTYGEVTRPQSLRFSFVRVNNPFTSNDFSLVRNTMYKDSWFNSVELWRR